MAHQAANQAALYHHLLANWLSSSSGSGGGINCTPYYEAKEMMDVAISHMSGASATATAAVAAAAASHYLTTTNSDSIYDLKTPSIH
jgi:hypothetical protein